MTECNELIIKCLNCFMNDCSLSTAVEKKLLLQAAEKAKEQKLIPAVYFVLEKSFREQLETDEYEKLRQSVFVSTVSQMQKTAELVRVFRLLEDNNIVCIVFKGAVLRAMYTNSDYRISSDEDLLLKASDMKSAAELLCRNGYEISSDKGREIKLVNRRLRSVLELHSSVAPDDNSRYDEINSALNSQLDCPERMNVGAGEVSTFSPTYGFLALCVHFYNHFIMSGIGIRQVMDIACFYKKYSERTDMEFVFSMLGRLRAAKLIDTVLAVGSAYFGIDYKSESEIPEALVDEFFDAGIYGTSNADRVHSGAVTAGIAKGKSGMAESLFSSVFPSKESILKSHPELEEKTGEINKYRFKRIAGFAAGRGKLKTLSYAGKRKKLLKELEIID